MDVVKFEPGAVRQMRELMHESSTAADLLMLLLDLASSRRRRTVEATYATLMQEMECSRATVSRAIRLLRERGWVISDGSKHRLQRINLARVKHPDEPDTPTALYRHYSADDELLYVGISKSAAGRLAQHMAGSQWAREIARVEIDHLPSREEALAAEKEAIKEESPLWNKAHNKPRKPRTRRKTSSADEIMPSQAYLDHLENLALPGHEAALTCVRKWVRFCPYPEWVLLELPEGTWGALWFQGYGTDYTDMVMEGDYSLLSIVADTREEALRHMAKNLMFPVEDHADMFALQRGEARP